MENHLQILFFLFLIPCALPNLSGASSSGAVFEVWKRLINNLPLAQQQEAAARGVLQRLLPRHVDSFHFQIVPTELCDGKACFFISNYSGKNLDGLPEISIKGTTGVELCAGLHWYLKNLCGAHISWDITGGPQLATVPEPGSLPRLLDRVEVQRPVPWNYYQNVVTSSYSYVWWNWKRWEKELDWMALQGINLPLAFTGQEAIWQKVYQSYNFNLTKDDLDDYFGGPAFLAWARMGNLHRWGGPLPQTWLDGQLVLQKQILYRMRNLGMVAVLPAFSGNVPHALMKIYPSANITRLSNWNTVHGDPRWCCTYLLQPTDPLFIKIGKSFVERQILEYGFTNHIYNCDTFNENKPPTNDTLYISSLARAVYAGMTAGDGSAIWLMQGWLFASDSQYWRPPQMKALLHAVPFGRMIVLDLFADVKPIWSRSEHFYGVPYIWCMLHNFGGNMEMYGRLDVISSGPIAARRSLNSTMVGVGMCMEGIEQNPVVYELMAEMAFQSDDIQLERWLESYVTRRYGQTAPEVQSAWKILHHTVYNCSDGTADHNTDVIVKFPDINASLVPDVIRESRHLLSAAFQLPGHNWYSPVSVKMALAYLLNASVPICKAPTFRYDLVDLTRQMLSKLANQLYMSALLSFENKDMVNLKKYSILLLDLLVDLETVLQSDNGFLLGHWLENAKQMATSQNEMELYEWNARTQITMWFDNTYDEPSSLHDYANKMWSGLVKDYYLPRAALYLDLLQSAMVNNTVFPFHLWRVNWVSLTSRWQNAKDNYPTISEGDPLQVSKSVFDKYAYLVEDVELDLAR